MKTDILAPECALAATPRAVKKVKAITFPMLLLLFYVFFEYGRPLFLSPIKPVFLVTGLLGLSLLSAKQKLMMVIRQRFFVAFLLLLVAMCLNVFLATNNYVAYVHLKTMFTYFVIGVSCCVFLDSKDKLRKFIFVMISVTALCAINMLSKHDFLGISGRGLFGDENDFALLMNTMVPVAFFLGRVETGWKRWFLWTAALLFVLANVDCASRGGFLGLAVVGVVCFYYFEHKFTAMVVIGLVASLVWTFAAPDFKEEILEIGADSADRDTGKDRVELWKIGWRAFVHNPVLGVGQGNIPIVMDIYKYDETGETYFRYVKWGRAIHSIYFTLLSELGAVGVVLVILMLKDLLRKHRLIRRICANSPPSEDDAFTRNINMALMASISGFLVSGAFLSVFYYPMLWHVSAMIVTLYMISTQSERGMSARRV